MNGFVLLLATIGGATICFLALVGMIAILDRWEPKK